MRFKLYKTIGFFVVLINVIVVYYVWRIFITFRLDINLDVKELTTRSPTKHLSKLVTVVLREFELYENDVSATVRSFTNVFPNIPVLILCDSLPYPPLDLFLSNNVTYKNIKVINLKQNLNTSYVHHYFLSHIQTKYVLFVPDSTRLPNKQIMQFIINEVSREANVVLAIPVSHADLVCFNIIHNSRQWIIKYNTIKDYICDAVEGKHLTIIENQVLMKLPNVELLPFPHSLYLQTSVLNYTVKILQGITFQEGKSVLKSHHAQLVKQQSEELRLKNLYNTFRIKQTIINEHVHWYGCSKDTSRCFPTILNSIPSYLYEGKWTPPCCLENLRKTALHVFNSLDEGGVRYWLESGSLLAAMRNSDILPWDYDVDIGINKDDINRCLWLEKAKNRPTIDNKGFLWERATESNFFRVHFSRKNRIHVNLFPFYAKNGTMTKDSWFTNHRNMEFPDHFLHPMSSIEFIGRHVPSPNNIRDFLEIKFGKGSIENPRYPDPSIIFP